MSEPAVSVRLEGRRRNYQPGDYVCGECHVDAAQPEEVRAVELSVIWFTEGKGEEDEGLHHFQRHGADEGPFDPAATIHFRTAPLPASPQSYEGRIVKIRWCVRVRLFLPRGETLVHDHPFQLGDVPPPAPPEPAPAPSAARE